MKRMPSTLSRLRISVVAFSIWWVSGLIRSKETRAPNMLSTADSTITMPIRIRKITTGCGTMLPTFSTPSRKRCIAVLGAVLSLVDISASPQAGTTPGTKQSSRRESIAAVTSRRT
jgi:hypothetical protein